MVFCIRKAVFTDDHECIKNIGQQIKSLGVPIELGLPFDFYNSFQAIKRWLPRLAEELRDHSVPCIAIHAPEGPVVTYQPEDFLDWAHDIGDLSNKVGARMIIFHPQRASMIDDDEALALLSSNIKSLQQETTATVVLETFSGGERFNYKCLAAARLPLCLDTSHMGHKDAVTLVEKRHDQIKHVHLSEAQGRVTHRPVGKEGKAVMKRLAELRWDGTVCIEYLDRYVKEMIEDCKWLTGIYGDI